jgi:hypothetical protein
VCEILIQPSLNSNIKGLAARSALPTSCSIKTKVSPGSPITTGTFLVARSARLLYYIITDFITYNTRGNLVTRKVPVVIGDPGETFVLIEQEVGSALRAASPFMLVSVMKSVMI